MCPAWATTRCCKTTTRSAVGSVSRKETADAIKRYIKDREGNDQMCDQLSFKEYEDPFKNVADFDEDDSPEIPTDGRISK